MAVRVIMFLAIIALVVFIVKSSMEIIIGGKLWGKFGKSLNDIDVTFSTSQDVLKEFGDSIGIKESAEQIERLEAVVQAKPTEDNVVQMDSQNPRRAGARAKDKRVK